MNTTHETKIHHIDEKNIGDIDDDTLRTLSSLNTKFKEVLYPHRFHGNISIGNIRKQVLEGLDILYPLGEGELPIGFAVGEVNEFGWYTYDGIFILPEGRGRGTARILIQELIEMVICKYNVPWITCEIHEWNKRSLELHQSMGFILDSDIPNKGKFTLELDVKKLGIQ